MSKASDELALKILALVDEFPSELFSFERKQVEQKISEMVQHYSEELDDELDASYQSGYDEGYDEGYLSGQEEANEDLSSQIIELEEELEQARTDLADMNAKIDQAFAEGYETASKGDRVIETLDFN